MPRPARCARLEPSIVANRRLVFYAYFLLVEGEYWPQGQTATLDALTALGFRVNPHRVRVDSVDGMVKFIDNAEKKRATLGYEIDGVVLKVDSHATQQRLGYTGRAAALGDRLQIHRPSRRDPGPRHHHQRGTNR